MKKTLLTLCSFLILSSISCSSDKDEETIKKDENVTQPQTQKIVLNISDAKSLVILENSPSGKNLATGTNLFKVTADGAYLAVNFTNKDGSATSTNPIVTSARNLNSTYVLLTGDFNYPNEKGELLHYSSILVRKTDGAIYNFGTDSVLATNGLGDNSVKSDAQGNIYYRYGGKINKLSLSNPENIQRIDYLPSGQTPSAFEVDANGNCIYRYGQSKGVTSSNGTNDIRIRKANGGIYEVKIEGRDNKEFWLGNNGKFYFITYTWDNNYLPKIHQIDIDDDNISTKIVWSPSGPESFDGVGHMFLQSGQGSYIIKKEKSVVFIDTYYNWGNMDWEFYEDDNSVENIQLPRIEQGAKIVYSKEYYYIATKTDLYKVNLNTHDYTKLTTSGEYEVYTISVDANDKVQFSALRLKDGKKIFAEISKEGTLKTIDEEINRKAIVLERIN